MDADYTVELPVSRRGSVHGHVINTLGARIVAGEFTIGGFLPREEELAGALGVSRGALREAVKALVAKRLLQVSPRTGTRVAPRQEWNFLDTDVLRWLDTVDRHSLLGDLTELRTAIEPGAAALAAVRATDQDRADIQGAYAAMERAAQANDLPLFVAADVDFHAAMLRACHNDLFISLGEAIEFLLRASFSVTSQAPGAIAASLPLHGLVLAAVLAQEPATASAASASLVSVAGHNLSTVTDPR